MRREGGSQCTPLQCSCSQVSPSPYLAPEAEEKGKVGALTFLRLGRGVQSLSLFLSLSLSLWVSDAQPPPVVKALAAREARVEDKLIPEEKKKMKSHCNDLFLYF